MAIENVRSTPSHRPGDDLIAAAGTAPADTAQPNNPLDGQDAVDQFTRLREWLEDERDKQRFNRFQMALDEDYYDGLQIDEEQLHALNERRQAPLVYNRIALVVDWLLGTEVRTRFDWKVRPRGPDDADGALVKTDLLKYIEDVNHSGEKRSAAFQDQIVAGLGWLEHGITTDPAAEPIFNRKESWRNVWYDSRSVEDDLSDARYLFRQRWVDLDFAQAMFPDRKAVLVGEGTGTGDRRFGTDEDDDIWWEGKKITGMTDSSAESRYVAAGTWSMSQNRRQRVRLIEAWWRTPMPRQVIRGAQFDGQVMDPNNPGHQAAIATGESVIVSNIGMQMQHAIFTDGGLLHMGPMPYRHNRFPLIPVWCKRRKRDNAPYGIVRAMRDAQDDFNKRRAKALWLLSTRGVIMDEGSVDADMIETLRAEVARPDFIISKRRGADLKIVDGAELVPAQLSFAEGDLEHIESAGGVTDEQLGKATNAVAGVAIAKRQLQGAVTSAPIFSKYRLAFELSGQINLSLAEQYYTWPRVLRLTGDRGANKFTGINQPAPQANDGTSQYLNDVTKSEADFIVDSQNYEATARQALFDSLSALFTKLPEAIQAQNLDLLLELVDEPSVKQMVQRIRQQNGIPDPDGPKTPEEAQAQEQMQADQAQAKDVQRRIMLAGADEAEANARIAAGKIDLNKANALKFLANVDALKGQGMQAQITGLYEAIQAAMAIILTPQVAPIADAIALSAGFHDENAPPIFPSVPATPGGQPLTPQMMSAPKLLNRNQPPPIAPAATAPSDVNTSIGPTPPVRAAGAQAGIQTLRPDGAQP